MDNIIIRCTPSADMNPIDDGYSIAIWQPLKGEKSLEEMGFGPNGCDRTEWGQMRQAEKNDLYALLRKMIENYVKPNLRIVINAASFYCHMMVLQCYSEYFMAYQSETVIELPAEKITSRAFVMMYDWMMHTNPQVKFQGIIELLRAARFLRVTTLVEQIWVCLDNTRLIREHSAFHLYKEAKRFLVPDVERIMLHRVSKFFLPLVSSMDFALMNFEEVCNLLKSSAIAVNSEVEVLFSAVRWLNYDWDHREQYLVDVMKCVRFGLMPPWLLIAFKKNVQCRAVQRATGNKNVQKMIEENIVYTTTQLYYGDSPNRFLSALDRYKLTMPDVRKSIYDSRSPYHHSKMCRKMEHTTYENFQKYMKILQTDDLDYEKTMIVLTQRTYINCCKESKPTPKKAITNLDDGSGFSDVSSIT